jgi:hypothetical protein
MVSLGFSGRPMALGLKSASKRNEY